MNGMKLMRSCHIVAWLGRIRVVWCDSRILMIRTTNGFPRSGSTKQRSLRMNSFFVKTQLQEGQQNRSVCDPLLVNERSSRSYDKWRDRRRAPLLVLLSRLPRMRALGLLLQLPLRVLLHHRPHGLGAPLSRRFVMRGTSVLRLPITASFKWFESLCFSLGNLRCQVGCCSGVFLCIGIYIFICFDTYLSRTLCISLCFLL